MDAPFQANQSVRLQQDAAWRALVLQFLQLHAPATVNGVLRGTLRDLARDFFNTTQDVAMQSLLLTLHAHYNLTGLIDAGLLRTMHNNAANRASTMMQQQLPLTRPPPPTQPTAPSYTFSNPPTMPPMPPQSPMPPPPRSPPLQLPTFLTQQPALRRCFPPNFNCHVAIKWRQQDWAYVCDLCGHTHPDRGDFNRHMRIGAQRVNFKIVSADPENDRHWYGVDGAGNEYMGDIVARTRNKEKGGKRVQVQHPPPCGPRIVEFERPSRQRARIAAKEAKERAAKLREQGDENDGDDQEGEQENSMNTTREAGMRVTTPPKASKYKCGQLLPFPFAYPTSSQQSQPTTDMKHDAVSIAINLFRCGRCVLTFIDADGDCNDGTQLTP